jgi:hypothetical protein
MSVVANVSAYDVRWLRALRETMAQVQQWAEVQAAEFVTATWSSGISITFDEGRLTVTATGRDYRVTAEEIDEWLERLAEGDV